MQKKNAKLKTFIAIGLAFGKIAGSDDQIYVFYQDNNDP